jgi:hypothetical protein
VVRTTVQPRREPGRAGGVAVGLIMALASAAIPTIDSNITREATRPSAVSTASPPPGAAISADDEALLAQLKVAAESPRTGYNRRAFRHWVDDDGDGCNAREEVLIAESRPRPALEPGSCRVLSGRWFSEYDGLTETVPRRVDVDHLVPLAEAWDSGAFQWDPERREEYANNLEQTEALIAVTASSNRSKGDKDPFEWMPSRGQVRCSYLRNWVKVKVAWELTADPDEAAALRRLLAGCPASRRGR